MVALLLLPLPMESPSIQVQPVWAPFPNSTPAWELLPSVLGPVTGCSPQEDLLDSQAPAAAAYPGQPTAVTAVEAATAAAEAPGSAEAPAPTAEREAQRMLQTQVHPLGGSGNTLEGSETGSYILTPHKPSHPWP